MKPEAQQICNMHASTDPSSLDDVAPVLPTEDSICPPLSWPVAERIVPSLFTDEDVVRLCRMYDVPEDFVARPAGDLRICSPPPERAVCVYSHALEAGLCRAPLQDFFCEVLRHFSLAPSQLAPNGWRNMAHFHGLCRSAGVEPSLTLFRQFFHVYKMPKSNGWYSFRSTHIASPARLPTSNSSWKEGFFFLSSPPEAEWTCPVQWGEPSEESRIQPVLKPKEADDVTKLLSARGSASADVMKTMRVKIEPESDMDTPAWSPLSGKKRNLEESDISLLQAVKNAMALQKKLVDRERDAAAESRARREELKKLTAVLDEAVKAASASENQKSDLLQEEVKKLTAELSDVKEATKAEGEKSAALQLELEKLKAAEAKKAELVKVMKKEFDAYLS